MNTLLNSNEENTANNDEKKERFVADEEILDEIIVTENAAIIGYDEEELKVQILDRATGNFFNTCYSSC